MLSQGKPGVGEFFEGDSMKLIQPAYLRAHSAQVAAVNERGTSPHVERRD
jgi:hypothetical protein